MLTKGSSIRGKHVARAYFKASPWWRVAGTYMEEAVFVGCSMFGSYQMVVLHGGKCA